MIDNIVHYKRYCPRCNTELEIREGGSSYCNRCKRFISTYLAPMIPEIDYDTRMWSEKELKELIKKTVKELGEEE